MSEKLKTFFRRLLSTCFLLVVVAAALVATVYWENRWFCAGLICVMCNLAAVEWFLMLREKKAECNRWLILIGGLLFPWYAAGEQFDTTQRYVAGLALFVLLAFVCELVRMDYRGQSAPAALRSVGTTTLAFIYPGWLFAFALPFANPYSLPVLVALIAITKLSDIWAYLCGVLLGRRFISRPFSPAVSPKKSWEGIIGSLILTCLSAAIITSCMDPKTTIAPALLIGALIFIPAVAGDLAGSLIKRGIGVKDSSHLLPGIGGIIDLIDSPDFTVAAVLVVSSCV